MHAVEAAIIVGIDRAELRSEMQRFVEIDRELLRRLPGRLVAFGLAEHLKLLHLLVRYSSASDDAPATNIYLEEARLLLSNNNAVVRAVGYDCLIRARSFVATSSSSSSLNRLLSVDAEQRFVARVFSYSKTVLLNKKIRSLSSMPRSGIDILQRRDLLESSDDDVVADILCARSLFHELCLLLASDLSSIRAGPTTASDARNIVAEICIILNGVLDKTFDRFASSLSRLIRRRTDDAVLSSLEEGKFVFSFSFFSVRIKSLYLLFFVVCVYRRS